MKPTPPELVLYAAVTWGDLKAESAGNFMVSEVSVINIVSVGSSLHNTRYGSKSVSEFGNLRINWVVHSNLHPELTTI